MEVSGTPFDFVRKVAKQLSEAPVTLINTNTMHTYMYTSGQSCLCCSSRLLQEPQSLFKPAKACFGPETAYTTRPSFLYKQVGYGCQAFVSFLALACRSIGISAHDRWRTPSSGAWRVTCSMSNNHSANAVPLVCMSDCTLSISSATCHLSAGYT